jgi:hypothetical protein
VQGSRFRFDLIVFIVIDTLKRDAEIAEVIEEEESVPPTKIVKRSGRIVCQNCGHYKTVFAIDHRTICTKDEKRAIASAERCAKTFTGTSGMIRTWSLSRE